jgi:uncharacterized protein DUF4440
MELLLVLALLASAPAACRLSEPPTRAGLLAAEAHWVAALESRDVRALACRLAPAFTDTSWRGQLVSREAVLSALPSRGRIELALSELDAQVFGQIGVVRGLNTETGPDGKIVGKVRFTDLFVRGNGGWQALAAQETLVRD